MTPEPRPSRPRCPEPREPVACRGDGGERDDDTSGIAVGGGAFDTFEIDPGSTTLLFCVDVPPSFGFNPADGLLDVPLEFTAATGLAPEVDTDVLLAFRVGQENL
jgi:hypothetical protein